MSKKIIVPVSGGKDSQVVLALALNADRENVVAVHQNTGYDHPDTYEHIRIMEKHYGVTIQHTQNKYGGMFGFLEHAKYFPNSGARGCTQRLKQEPFAEWLVASKFSPENSEIWFGMRSDESAARNTKYGVLSKDDVWLLKDISPFYETKKYGDIGNILVRLPIVDWTTDDVFGCLRKATAPINPLYERGHVRVGCYPCLLARKSEWQAAGKDPIGQQHLKRLVSLEDQWREEGNTRKFIKVHRVWDVRDFLRGRDVEDLSQEQCGWCSI